MTSLSEQLLRLALPDGSLGRTHGISRPSLLFDSKEAVLFDKDTIYALGLNGFEELCKLNNMLHVQFFELLFSEKAKDLERTMKTKEFNKNLDKTINKFLLCISQYFLLRPAQKCVEWLIYRFHIHSYNVEGFLKCILPYHATNLFARAVQIIQPQQTTVKWSWLKNVQEDNTPLSMKRIVLLCNSHSSFFHLVCDMMQNSIQIAESDASSVRLHVKFFTSAVLGMLHYSKRLSDDVLTRIMPLLNKGFALKEETFQAAVLMIICQLSATVSLQTDSILAILDHCLQHCLPQLENELLHTVVLICETQGQLKHLPKRIAELLCKQGDFFPTLQQLVPAGSANNFISLLIECEVGQLCGEENVDKNLLLEMLKEVEVPTKIQAQLIRLLMEKLLSAESGAIAEANLIHGGDVLKFMQQRYAAVFDSTINQHFKDADLSDDMLGTVLQENKCNTIATLTIGLLHPSATVRVHSLKSLSKSLSDEPTEAADLQELAEANLKRLLKSETDDGVVVECLKVLEDHKTVLLRNLNEVAQLLIDIVLSQSFIGGTLCKVLSLLTSDIFVGKIQTNQPDGVEIKVLCLVLKVLLEATSSPKWKKQAMAIEKSHFMLQNKWLNIKGNLDTEQLTTKLLNAMSKLQPQILHSLLSYALACPSLATDENLHFSPFIWFLIKVSNVPGSLETGSDICEKVMTCVKQEIGFQIANGQLPSLNQESDNVLLSKMFKHAGGSSVWIFMFEALKQMVASVGKMKSADKKWENLRFDIFASLTQISYVIQRKSKKKAQKDVCQFLASVFKTYFETLFADTNELMLFLTDILLDDFAVMKERPVNLQVLVLLPVLLTSSASKPSMGKFFDSSPLVPTLVLSCTSDKEKIRQAAVNCLKVVSDIPSGYKDMATFLYTNSKEIQMDSDHLAQCLKSYFTSDPAAKSKSSQLRKKRESLLLEMLKKHVIGSPSDIEIGCFGLALLNNCLSEISTAKMFDVLNEAATKLMIKKADTELTEKDHHFLTIVVRKAVSCDTSSAKLLSLFSKTLKPLNENADFSTQCATLKLISRKQFNQLNKQEKNKLLDLVLQLKACPSSVEVTSNVNRVLKIIPLQAEHVVEKLKLCQERLTSDTAEPAKRKKLDKEIDSNAKFSHAYMLALLETLQQKKRIVGPQKLLAPLCSLLNDFVIHKLSDPSEYVAQLIIGCLHNLVKRIKLLGSNECPTSEVQKNLQLEPVVYFIQQTENSLVHREAILLLAESVQFFPDKIVHTIMSIFTFMGSSLLRRDDSYSFQVISQTIQSVVPALMALRTSKAAQQHNAVEQILQVFVDALPHIPAHRRLTVLKELLNAVGPSEYTWQTMVLLLAQRFTKLSSQKLLSTQMTSHEDDTKVAFSMEETVEICQSMTQLFSLDLQIKVVSNILKFSLELPNEIEKESSKSGAFRDLKNLMKLDKLPIAQLCNLRLGMFVLISHLLTLSNPVSKAFNELDEEDSESIQVVTARTEAFESLLLTALQLDDQVNGMREKAAVANKSEKYYNALCGKTAEILDKINQILPTGTMLLIVSRLLELQSHKVHLKVIHIFTKHISYGFKLSLTEVELFEKVAKHLIELIAQKSESSKLIGTSHYVAAAVALTRVVKVCGMECSSYFVGLIPTLCDLILQKGTDVEVVSSLLDCLGALVLTLKAHCIIHLPKICTCVLKLLGSKSILEQANALHATVKTVLALFQSVANFLSPYLVNFLYKLSPILLIHQQTPSSSNSDSTSTQSKRHKSHAKNTDDAALQLHATLQLVLNIIAKKTAPRLLIPAFSTCYEKVTAKCAMGNLCLVEVANAHLKNLNKKVLSINSAQFFAFYMKTLDFRSTQTQLSFDDIAKIEALTLDGIISLFLKLPEEEFQVLYHKLFMWGCSPESPISKCTTFYRCINMLASKLKSLFTSLAVDVLPHFAKLFETTPENQESADTERFVGEYQLCMSNGMEALTTLLRADASFINQERFDLVCHPVVAEMQKADNEEDSGYDVYVKKYVVPLISELASCSNNNIAWQPLHNQVLMNMRHNSKKVRMIALDTVLGIAEKLGQDYMSTIPDTIPFLAELMEDDDAEVEKHCHVITTKLEEVVGESLQKFF